MSADDKRVPEPDETKVGHGFVESAAKDSCGQYVWAVGRPLPSSMNWHEQWCGQPRSAHPGEEAMKRDDRQDEDESQETRAATAAPAGIAEQVSEEGVGHGEADIAAAMGRAHQIVKNHGECVECCSYETRRCPTLRDAYVLLGSRETVEALRYQLQLRGEYYDALLSRVRSEGGGETDKSWSEEAEAKQVMQALRRLKENPWDTITLHYDAGEWGITLSEDAVRTVEIEPGESLLDRLNAAIQYTRTGNEALLREQPPEPAPSGEQGWQQGYRAGLEAAAGLDDADAVEYERVSNLSGVSAGSISQLRSRARDCRESAARIRALPIPPPPSGEVER
jgi:hypothetical protein